MDIFRSQISNNILKQQLFHVSAMVLVNAKKVILVILQPHLHHVWIKINCVGSCVRFHIFSWGGVLYFI